jgi:putative oxidoreductase
MLAAMRGKTSGKDYALLILRMAGLLFAIGHGWGKIAGMVAGADGLVGMVDRLGFPMPYVFAWALALTEFVGGLLIAAGLFTRTAATFAAFAMGTAAFVRHKALLAFGAWLGVAAPAPATLEAAGDPERALLFFLIFLALIFLGGGRLSLERVLAERRR